MYNVVTVPQLFQYNDYRAFLHDYYQQQKKENPRFSYRYLGQKLGVDPGSLLRVFKGESHFSESVVETVASYLFATEKEQEYFTTLVRFNKAKNAPEADAYYRKLLGLKDLKLQTLSELQYQYFGAWYHAPVRGLIGMGSFRGDYATLAKQLSPAITEEQARQSVELLLALGLVKHTPAGEWLLVTPAVSTGDEWISYAIRKFQQDMMALAAQSLERFDKEQRDVSSVTVAISQRDLPRLKQYCNEFRKELMKMAVQTSDPDCVYQINVQLFPVGFQNERT